MTTGITIMFRKNKTNRSKVKVWHFELEYFCLGVKNKSQKIWNISPKNTFFSKLYFFISINFIASIFIKNLLKHVLKMYVRIYFIALGAIYNFSLCLHLYLPGPKSCIIQNFQMKRVLFKQKKCVRVISEQE